MNHNSDRPVFNPYKLSKGKCQCRRSEPLILSSRQAHGQREWRPGPAQYTEALACQDVNGGSIEIVGDCRREKLGYGALGPRYALPKYGGVHYRMPMRCSPSADQESGRGFHVLSVGSGTWTSDSFPWSSGDACLENCKSY